MCKRKGDKALETILDVTNLLMTGTVHHLSAELLLDDDVFHCVLPQHLFPPEPWRQ